MFARIALLLLLLTVLPARSEKLHDILANVGRRSTSVGFGYGKLNVKDIMLKRDEQTWESLSEEGVKERKEETAKKLTNQFLEFHSAENPLYKESLDWITSILSENLTTEICGSDKNLNMIQYLKYMKQAASQYVKSSPTEKKQHTVLDINSPKNEMVVFIMFEQTDKNGVKAVMHYDLTLNLTFVRRLEDSAFSITKLTQGGSCLDHGTASYIPDDDSTTIIKNLKDHPKVLSLFQLFTPNALQHTEKAKFVENQMNNLPHGWLLGLSADTKITIAQGEEAVTYTPDQFSSWYQRFGLMWHPKAGDDEAISMQPFELKDGVLHARVTMKLQIGDNETADVHNWEFKISGKENDDKTWTIISIDLLSPVTITKAQDLMDMNYLAYRDVLGAIFNLYINDREQWYPATDFMVHFKKHGEKFHLRSCMDDLPDVNDVPKTFWVLYRTWNATMLGYIIKDEMEPIPAVEDFKFTLRMKMQPPSEPPTPGDLFGSDWTFSVKWDKMDQFYYIHKAEFSCPKFMEPDGGHFKYLGKHRGIGGTLK